jgi:hypothetical protein
VRSFLGLCGDGTEEGGGDGDHGEKDRHREKEKGGLLLFARIKREEGGCAAFIA